MVKGYTDTEREEIRSTILGAARSLWETHGFKEVTVRRLAQASGISVGAFYLFFASKEALLFALLEEEEQTLKQELFSGPWLEPPLTRNKLSGLLQHAFDLATKNPIIRQAVEMDVYQQMASSVSPEAMEQHAAQDQLDLRPLLEWAKADCRTLMRKWSVEHCGHYFFSIFTRTSLARKFFRRWSHFGLMPWPRRSSKTRSEIDGRNHCTAKCELQLPKSKTPGTAQHLYGRSTRRSVWTLRPVRSGQEYDAEDSYGAPKAPTWQRQSSR